MKKIINENERGLLFNNGKFVKMLDAGKYHIFGDREIEVVSLEQPLESAKCTREVLLNNDKISSQTTVIQVGDEELAIHYIDGKFTECLRRGKYIFWNTYDKHEFKRVSIKSPEVADGVPRYIFDKIPSYLYTKIEVAEYQKARLYYDNKFVEILEAGTYYYWKCNIKVDFNLVDTRLTQLNITGQEILTKDKVSLRINLVCNYKIADYVKVLTETDDYKEQIHIGAQLALREYVGKYRIDEILENKEEMSSYVFDKLKERTKKIYVEMIDAGVKDIILPGEIRDIMNTVLIAEKRAQANVITRREEVASTRSLLNTAKLMEENQTLYKLKELEYLERICENVGNISVSGGDILSRLREIVSAKQERGV